MLFVYVYYWNSYLIAYAMGDVEVPYWQDYQVCLASKYIDHLLQEFFRMKNIVEYGNFSPIFI